MASGTMFAKREKALFTLSLQKNNFFSQVSGPKGAAGWVPRMKKQGGANGRHSLKGHKLHLINFFST